MPKLNQKERRRLAAIERAKHRSRSTRAAGASVIAFSASGWFTTSGLFAKQIEAGVDTMEGMATAFISGATSTTLMAVAVTKLFELTVYADRRHRASLIALGVALFPAIVGISTTYAILGNAGPASLVYDMRNNAVLQAEYYEARAGDAALANSAHAAILPLRSQVCGLAEAELESGILSASPGAGTITAAYFGACDSIQTILVTLQTTSDATIGRRTEASAVLQRLHDVPLDTSISVFDRQVAFREQVETLRTLLEESVAENVAERLRAQMDILAASVPAVGVRPGEFGERQINAVEGLRATLDAVSEALIPLTETAAAADLVKPAELQDMIGAVIAHWDRNIPQIMLAVLVDAMALWFACMLAVSNRILRDRLDELGM